VPQDRGLFSRKIVQKRPFRAWLVNPVLRQNYVASLNIDSFGTWRQIGLLMLNAIVSAIRFVILVFDHKQVVLDNAALRQQLAVFRREVKHPKLLGRDRLFWVALRMIWKDGKSALVIVRRDTVISWQRNRFKRFWRRLSQPRAVRQSVPRFASWFGQWQPLTHRGERHACMENC
jgi:hypothetical protein